mgnify:CR=1 FL=1|jgi:hypothetical protein
MPKRSKLVTCPKEAASALWCLPHRRRWPHLRSCRQREVYVEPEIDRPALILEMLLHTAFLMLMTYACVDKRIISEAFYLYQAP